MISSPTATKPATVSAELHGGRIVLRGPFSPALLEFCRSLPDAKWDGSRRCWSCTCTPIAAWRVFFERYGWEIDGEEELARAALEFPFRVGAENDTTQPERRKTDAWGHQARAYNFSRKLHATLLAMGMGTGKSKVTVDLMVNADARRVLILCPKSVMAVWRREVPKHSAVPFSVAVLDKGDGKRKVLDAETAVMTAGRSPLAVVINYDSAKLNPFAAWAMRREWDFVVCDESHRIKAHDTQVSKFCAKLGKQAKRRLCLTGTPIGNSPLDVFGQFRFLDAGVFGTGWTTFRQKYAICGNPAIPEMVTGYRDLSDLQARMALLTYRVGAEVLDLPPVNHHDVLVPMTAAGVAVYDRMERDFIAQLRSGVVTAGNAMVRALRLRQICSGFLQPDGAPAPEDVDRSKIDALAELLEDVGPSEPVVVFGVFREDLRRIEQLAARQRRTYGEVSGSRKDLTRTGEMPPDVDVLGVQVSAGGLGIDLTRACYGVYYNHPWSLTDYEQSLARINRPGQTRPVHYYHLLSEGTVDVDVHRALASKQEVVDSILNLFRQGKGTEQ